MAAEMKTVIKVALALTITVSPTVLSASCNTFESIQKTLSARGCQYLGPTTNSKGTVYTWVCSHRNGDEYKDYKKKDGKFCYVGSEVI
jgi:hypothetical protein